ncbi:RPA-related protein RADX [Amia ocellicauda]|uniref:RPA-related protein RADX n=1 Tax=Amia ocellicauda TaxID=2972642 RepID=UPI003464948F
MAARRAGCAVQRTLSQCSAASPVRRDRPRCCSGPLFLLAVHRYMKDPGVGLHFPQAVASSEWLYDATLSDGHCRLRATLHPGLNALVEGNRLRCGCELRNVTFCPGAEEAHPGHLVLDLELNEEAGAAAGLAAFSGVDVEALPWFGSDPDGPPKVAPLRARRCCYLPLWNNQDYCGELWRARPPSPPADSDSEETVRDLQPVCLRELRRSFFSRSRRRQSHSQRPLTVRVLRKSRLLHFGKTDRACECPYQAVLEVADSSDRAAVVLWNSLCLDWYRGVEPGTVLSIHSYRVKESYGSRSGSAREQDIEISLNSRNPSAELAVVPESAVLPQWNLPSVPFHFLSREELPSCPQGHTCDFIGLVTFAGRPERLRVRGQGEEQLKQYRWLQLEDGTGGQPVAVKLFATSQPEEQAGIHPLSVLVCTSVQLMKTSSVHYLTSTRYTQVYCTGQHQRRPYRRLPPVRRFIQWLKTVDEDAVARRAVIGGFFSFPPLAASMDQYLQERSGDPGLVSAAELQREAGRLLYRERRCFAIQGTVVSVTHSDCDNTVSAAPGCDPADEQLSWSSSSAPLSPCSSLGCPWSPRNSGSVRLGGSGRRAQKRLFVGERSRSELPRKRLVLPPPSPRWSGLHTDADADSGVGFSLWEATMEFLEKDDGDEEGEEEDGVGASCGAAPPTASPGREWAGPRLGRARAARETLPRRYSHARREVQALALGLQPETLQRSLPDSKLDTFSTAAGYSGHYTVTLRDLSRSLVVQAVFLPSCPGDWHCPPLPQAHSNSWLAVLAHGGFSPGSPPPAPSDLLSMAAQLTGRRLLLVLELCQLGGGRLEAVLSRAFPLDPCG